MEDALKQASLTKRQLRALLRRLRVVLSERSTEKLFDQVLMDADVASQRVDLAVGRVRSLAGRRLPDAIVGDAATTDLGLGSTYGSSL